MLNKEGHTAILDWYLFGVLLYEMVEGLPPFYDNDKAKLFYNILHNPLDLSDDLSDEICDLLVSLL